MPNHFHGIVEFVGVPLVGTQNVRQPETMGQPQGIAPTVGDVVGALKHWPPIIFHFIRVRDKTFIIKNANFSADPIPLLLL